jgi:hypothetical protein
MHVILDVSEAAQSWPLIRPNLIFAHPKELVSLWTRNQLLFLKTFSTPATMHVFSSIVIGSLLSLLAVPIYGRDMVAGFPESEIGHDGSVIVIRPFRIISAYYPGKEQYVGMSPNGAGLTMTNKPDSSAVFQANVKWDSDAEVTIQVDQRCMSSSGAQVILTDCNKKISNAHYWRITNGTIRSSADLNKCLTIGAKSLRMDICSQELQPSQIFMVAGILEPQPEKQPVPSNSGLHPYVMVFKPTKTFYQWKANEKSSELVFTFYNATEGINVVYRQYKDAKPTLNSVFKIIVDKDEKWCVANAGGKLVVQQCKSNNDKSQLWRSVIAGDYFKVQSVFSSQQCLRLFHSIYVTESKISACSDRMFPPELAFVPTSWSSNKVKTQNH